MSFLLNFWRWNNCHLQFFHRQCLQGLLFGVLICLILYAGPLLVKIKGRCLIWWNITFIRNLILLKLNRICGLNLNILLPLNLSNHPLTFHWVLLLLNRFSPHQLASIYSIGFQSCVAYWRVTQTLRIVDWVVFPTNVLLLQSNVFDRLAGAGFDWVWLIAVVGPG
jgi:hypothetical protein